MSIELIKRRQEIVIGKAEKCNDTARRAYFSVTALSKKFTSREELTEQAIPLLLEALQLSSAVIEVDSSFKRLKELPELFFVAEAHFINRVNFFCKSVEKITCLINPTSKDLEKVFAAFPECKSVFKFNELLRTRIKTLELERELRLVKFEILSAKVEQIEKSKERLEADLKRERTRAKKR